MDQDQSMSIKDKKTSFFSQGVYGCVSYPRLRCDGNPVSKRDKKKTVSKVVVYNAIARNELHIGKKLRESTMDVPKHMFVYFKKACKVENNLLKKNKKLSKSCKVFQRNEDDPDKSFVMMHGPYIKSNTIQEHWRKVSYEKIIDLYDFALEAIDALLKLKIVHNDLKTNNILVHDNNKSVFSLVDFGLSIDVDKCLNGSNSLNVPYMKSLFIYDPRFIVWSLEHHLICYYFNYGKIVSSKKLRDFISYSLSYSLASEYYDVEKVYSYYASRLYEHDAITTMRTLFLDSYKTWDLYACSYMCLSRIKNQSNLLENRENTDLVRVLEKALHYDYRYRPSPQVHKEALEHFRKDTL